MESGLVVQLLLALSVIIAAAQLAGIAARRLGQPRVLGELLAGVILGPSLLNLLNWTNFADTHLLQNTVAELAELGVIFLMFGVGLEIHLGELVAVRRVALWSGIFGGLVSVLMVFPVVLLFDHSADMAIFTGVAMAATSVSISAQTLLELGVLRTKEGIALLAAAVVDDVLAILMLSVATAMFGKDGNASWSQLLWIFTRLILYLVGALLVAWLALPRLFNRLHRERDFSPSVASFALIAALLFGWAAEALGGVAAVTGAFIAGVGLAQSSDKPRHDISAAIRSISYTLFVPIFFVNVGLNANLREVGLKTLPLAALLLIAVLASKIIGNGLGARIGGFSSGESFRLGTCMVSRGEVSLIIATLGVGQGLISHELFQAIFLVVLLTTVITPPIVRWAFGSRGAGGSPALSANPTPNA